MNRKIVSLILICLAANAFVNAQNKQKANIIFLFADDAGYHDFGFHGTKTFKTPNLDQLASEGVIFRQAYTTASVCGPSRAGLLTGMYPQRFGFEENNVPGFMSESSKLIDDEMGLPLHVKTIADYLNPLGYKSIILGKWHMGNVDRYHPLYRGFDEFYGFRGGARSFWPLTQKDAAGRPENRLEKGFRNYEEPTKYLTDAIADEACDFMERNQTKPFFMYVSFNAVHSPLQATKEDLDEVDSWGFKLKGNRRTLAAMTLALDRACGTILSKLKELGLEENTLVVFSDDNGGPDVTNTCNYPLSGGKAFNLEGGIRVPCVMKLPNVIKAKSEYVPPISLMDLLPTFVNVAGGDAGKIEGIDGVDLIPFLTQKNKSLPHEKLFWKEDTKSIVRDGDFKLHRFPDRPVELYNIAEDITESHNLAEKYPEKVKEMYKTLWAWESTLERPLWMLKRKYEVRALQLYEEKRTPVLDELDNQ